MDVMLTANHPLKQIMSLESPVAPTMKKSCCIFGIHNTFAHPKLLLFWLLRLERRWHGPWETNIQDDHNCTTLRKRDRMLDVNKSSKAIFKLFFSFLVVWLWLLSRPIHYLTVVVYTTTFSVWPCNLHFLQDSHILFCCCCTCVQHCTTDVFNTFLESSRTFYDIIENLFFRGDFLSEPLYRVEYYYLTMYYKICTRHYWRRSRCLKITRKSHSFNIASGRSELYLHFEWTKVH